MQRNIVGQEISSGSAQGVTLTSQNIDFIVGNAIKTLRKLEFLYPRVFGQEIRRKKKDPILAGIARTWEDEYQRVYLGSPIYMGIINESEAREVKSNNIAVRIGIFAVILLCFYIAYLFLK